jgi:hypothetical protein
MSFASKYKCTFQDMHGLVWLADILEDGATNVTDLTPSDNPLTFEHNCDNDDIFEPIKESFANINVLSSTNFSLADLYSTEDQHFKVNIYYGSAINPTWTNHGYDQFTGTSLSFRLVLWHILSSSGYIESNVIQLTSGHDIRFRFFVTKNSGFLGTLFIYNAGMTLNDYHIITEGWNDVVLTPTWTGNSTIVIYDGFACDYLISGLVIHGMNSYWNGWVDCGNYEEPYEQPPYPVTIKCTDGLSFLKEYEYKDGSGNIYNGRILESQIVLDILGKIGYTTFKEYVNIYETNMVGTVTDSPMDQIKLDADVFLDMRCQEVLINICRKYGCFLRMVDGVFSFVRPNELDGATVYGRYFTTATAKTGISLSPEQQIRRSGSSTDRIQVPGGVQWVQKPSSAVYLRFDYGNKGSWVENYEFNGDTFTGDLLSGYTVDNWTKSAELETVSGIYPYYYTGEETAEGIFINEQWSPSNDAYLYQVFGSDLKSTSDALVISFEYLHLNQGAGTANLDYTIVITDGTNYLYAVDTEYCDWDSSLQAIGGTDSVPVGTSGWKTYTRRVNGLPSDGPYTIKLYGLEDYSANCSLAYRNIRFYATSDKITWKKTKSYYWPFGWAKKWVKSFNYIDRKEVVNENFPADPDTGINGDITEYGLLLGDVTTATTGIDNVLEQFAGSLQTRSYTGYRVDTIHLKGGGAGEEATVTCNNVVAQIEYDTNLDTTAANFVTDHAVDFAAEDVTLTAIAHTLYFTSDIAGVEYTGDTTIVPDGVDTLDGDVTMGVAYVWASSTAWDTRGGSENAKLLEIVGTEIKNHLARPRQIIQMNIQEDYRYVTGTDRPPQVNMIGRIEDSLNTYGGNARHFVINAGEFSVINRSWTVDLIEII